MATKAEIIARQIGSAIMQTNEQNEAEVRTFLSGFVKENQTGALLQVWVMLAKQASIATGLERVAANLAVLEFGQQLERLLLQKGGPFYVE